MSIWYKNGTKQKLVACLQDGWSQPGTMLWWLEWEYPFGGSFLAQCLKV